jgi:ubiquinone/menaquinone biosynthesis C-methylase UbiE
MRSRWATGTAAGLVLLGALAVLVSVRAASTQRPAPAPAPSDDADGQYGNPSNLDDYIAELSSPARDAWQKPDQVVAALGLKAGETACDIGSGPGYFTLRLARAVGSSGLVYAVDVEPRLLDALKQHLRDAKVENVVPVLAHADDSLLAKSACDLILVVNTYHHFPDRVAYLRRLARSLRAGGRIVNVDFTKTAPIGPPAPERISREEFLRDAESAGLKMAAEHTFLPYQYAVELKNR